jgi:hypothetical protein
MFMLRTVLLLTLVLGFTSNLIAAPNQAGKGPVKAAPADLAKTQVERIRVNTPTGPVEYVVTTETEIKLDGRDCKWEDIPDNVVITAMEVAAEDDVTVLRIFFRTKTPK